MRAFRLNCLGLVADRKIPCPPCMAWLRLNDELTPGICECDWNAGIGQRLCQLLLVRPGFQQDPAPNTVNNTLMGADCSGPTKLRGPDEPPVPMILRSHSESGIGVSPQVLRPEGEAVTVMTFVGPKKILVGTGRVVANIDTPPSGGCRTSVELQIDNTADSRDCVGFHQMFRTRPARAALPGLCATGWAGVRADRLTASIPPNSLLHTFLDPIRLARMVNKVEWLKGRNNEQHDPHGLARG